MRLQGGDEVGQAEAGRVRQFQAVQQCAVQVELDLGEAQGKGGDRPAGRAERGEGLRQHGGRTEVRPGQIGRQVDKAHTGRELLHHIGVGRWHPSGAQRLVLDQPHLPSHEVE